MFSLIEKFHGAIAKGDIELGNKKIDEAMPVAIQYGRPDRAGELQFLQYYGSAMLRLHRSKKTEAEKSNLVEAILDSLATRHFQLYEKAKEKNDTDNLIIEGLVSTFLFFEIGDTISSKNIRTHLIELSRSSQYNHLEPNFLLHMANYHSSRDNEKNALIYINMAEESARRIGKLIDLAYILNAKATLKDLDWSSRKSMIMESIKLAKDYGLISLELENLVLFSENCPDFDLALKTLVRAEKIGKKVEFFYVLGQINMLLAYVLYEKEGEFSDELVNYIDTAKNYYKKGQFWNDYVFALMGKYSFTRLRLRENGNPNEKTYLHPEIQKIISEMEEATELVGDSEALDSLYNDITGHYFLAGWHYIEQYDTTGIPIYINKLIPYRLKWYEHSRKSGHNKIIEKLEKSLRSNIGILQDDAFLGYLFMRNKLLNQYGRQQVTVGEISHDTTAIIEGLYLSHIPDLNALVFHDSTRPEMMRAETLAIKTGDPYIVNVYQLITLNDAYTYDFVKYKTSSKQFMDAAHKYKMGDMIVQATTHYVQASMANGASYNDKDIQNALSKVTNSHMRKSSTGALLSYASVIWQLGSDKKAADVIARKAVKKLEKEPIKISLMYKLVAAYYVLTDRPELALDYLYKGLQLAKDNGEIVSIAQIYSVIGEVEGSTGNIRKAIQAYNVSIEVYKEIGQTQGAIRGLYHSSMLLDDIGETDRAKEFLSSAMELAQSDTTLDWDADFFLMSNFFSDEFVFEKEFIETVDLSYMRVMLALRAWEHEVWIGRDDEKVKWENYILAQDLNFEKLSRESVNKNQGVSDILDKQAAMGAKLIMSIDKVNASINLNNEELFFIYLVRGIQMFFQEDQDYKVEFYNAEKEALRSNNYNLGSMAYKFLGMLYLDDEDYKNAEKSYIKSAEYASRAFLNFSDIEQSIEYSKESYYILSLIIIAMTSDWEDDFTEEQIFKLLEISEQLYARTMLMRINDGKALNSGAKHLVNRRRQFENEINSQTNLLSFEENGTRRLVIQNEIGQLYEKLSIVDNDIRSRDQNFFDDSFNVEPVSVELLKEGFLEPKQILLRYFVYDGYSLMIAVAPNGGYYYDPTLPSRDELALKIKQLMNAYKMYPLSQDKQSIESTQIKLGRELYDILLSGLAEQLEDGFTDWELVIIPDRELNLLPFEALILPDESIDYSTRIDIDELPFLIKEADVSYAPSISTFYHLKNNIKAQTRKNNILSLGNNSFSVRAQSEEAVAATTRSVYDMAGLLTDLNYAELEAEVIYNLFKNYGSKTIPFFSKSSSKLLIGDKAQEKAIKSMDLQGYRYLHFSTHGVIDDVRPHFSSILMNEVAIQGSRGSNDGYLQAFEISSLDMNADMVTLSACNTGLGKMVEGAGIVGLNQALFAAGARSVCLSLWSVDDQSTGIFMTALYAALLSGFSKAEAIRQAKLYMMRETEYKNPYYWAPFVLIGES